VRLLVAESHQDDRELIGLQLAPLGHVVDFADNGAAVVKQFRSQSYDLVIVDVELPVIDGVSAARTIRSWELMQEFEPTPIIALTTTFSEPALRNDLNRAFTDYLVKPFDQDHLLGTIRRHARSPF
jgi:two-component system sensor histidine kinase/response regulator